jgi:hypothetical protein
MGETRFHRPRTAHVALRASNWLYLSQKLRKICRRRIIPDFDRFRCGTRVRYPCELCAENWILSRYTPSHANDLIAILVTCYRRPQQYRTSVLSRCAPLRPRSPRNGLQHRVRVFSCRRLLHCCIDRQQQLTRVTRRQSQIWSTSPLNSQFLIEMAIAQRSSAQVSINASIR